MIKKILGGIVGLAVILAAIGFILPNNIHVERSIVINAPQEDVFALVNSFQNFNKWSPWYEREPDANYSYEGPETGVGAITRWKGEEVGAGSQEIVESHPHDSIRVVLDFEDQGRADSYYLFETVDGGTKVIWGFDTEMGYNPVARYMGLMMDKWVGGDYEHGLANLKTLAETQP